MSTPDQAEATPLNMCHVSRTCCDERVAPCCPTSATQQVTTCQNAWARECRVVTPQVEFGL